MAMVPAGTKQNEARRFIVTRLEKWGTLRVADLMHEYTGQGGSLRAFYRAKADLLRQGLIVYVDAFWTVRLTRGGGHP